MDRNTARSLSDLTTDFYRHVHTSFSATRQTPWQGWDEVMRYVRADARRRLNVLDLACGNLRFERYLCDCGYEVDAWAYDNCDDLVVLGDGPELKVNYRHLDIAEVLFDGTDLGDSLDAPPCDLSVCFGFLHHVPLFDQRVSVLCGLVDATREGGTIAVSFWQFARSERLMAKARPVEGGDLGDYLLGWQQEKDVWRYCHSYTDEEIDDLAAACAPQAREVARLSADGKTGNLNGYLVLRKN